jgi:hypothetical protein
MSVARVAGMPDYTAGGASRFIPEVWSGTLIQKYYKSTVFGEIARMLAM